MDGTVIIVSFALIVALVSVAALAWVFLAVPGSRGEEIRRLMFASRTPLGAETPRDRGARDTVGGDTLDAEVERIKKLSGSSLAKKGRGEDLDLKLFKAGIYSEAARRRFKIARTVLPFLVPPLFYALAALFLSQPNIPLLVGALGLAIGAMAPGAWLDRAIRMRQEEVMYYLPLVIEQISIGVSSALDVGPCITLIVQMADERDSHNAVTEMFIHVEKLMRSGLNLEDALLEVGEASDMTEVKHAFMFLAQCARHGGEVSRQLQELADAVMVQRQVQVEGRITALPVKATGPLATIFSGFFILVLSGLAVRLITSLGGEG